MGRVMTIKERAEAVAVILGAVALAWKFGPKQLWGRARFYYALWSERRAYERRQARQRERDLEKLRAKIVRMVEEHEIHIGQHERDLDALKAQLAKIEADLSLLRCKQFP